MKIIGAGSIGNHLANAARRLGWSVDLCDIDPAALERTREDIYPGRYGRWDEAIRLFVTEEEPVGGYDLICVGTPPDSHISLALKALAEKPTAVLVEKPLCAPDLESLDDLGAQAAVAGIPVFTGYDHVVGAACQEVERLIGEVDGFGDITTIDVEFREHWSGIFGAHPWLDGPHDTYLGYWRRGGGASGEHSHATNLWQHFARLVGAGRVVEVSAALDYVDDGRVDYDRMALLTLRTEGGLLGRVVQDVMTVPPKKWGRIQGETGFVEWHCGFEPGCDAVISTSRDERPTETKIAKTRPDDFIGELVHIRDAVEAGPAEVEASPISLQRGLETMLVVAAAHRSTREKRSIIIDYAKGATPAALATA